MFISHRTKAGGVTTAYKALGNLSLTNRLSDLLLLNLVQSRWLSFCFWNILPLMPVSGPAFLHHSIYNYVALHYIRLFACERSPSTPPQWEWTSFALFTAMFPYREEQSQAQSRQSIQVEWWKTQDLGDWLPSCLKEGEDFHANNSSTKTEV